MAHEISINSVGQSEAVFGFGEKPWWNSSSMPATVLDGAVSFDQIFAIAFPWYAIMEQLQYSDGSLSSQHGIRRSDTLAELGVHSGNYGAIQPRDLFDFCAAFFQQYPQVPIASAIAMQGGAVLNLSARLGEINVLNSGDIHKSYLCFVNSFNGRIKAQVYKSYVRPVCMNTTISGISSADFTMAYKHTKNVRERIKRDSNNAAQLMMAQQATDERVKEILETLAKTKITRKGYEALLDDLFGESESTRSKNIKSEVTALFANNDNNAFPDFKNTAYNLYNAVTNYVDHQKTVRMTEKRGNVDINFQRFENATIGDGASFKMRALDKIYEKVLVMADGTEMVENSPMISLPSQPTRYLKTSDTVAYPGNTSKTSQNSLQSIQEDIGIELADYDDNAFIVPSEGKTEVLQDTPDMSDVLMDLYTLAPQKYDSPCTVHIEIVEQVNDTLVMRHVTVPENYVLAQIDVYKEAGYFVAGQKEWKEIQASKAK